MVSKASGIYHFDTGMNMLSFLSERMSHGNPVKTVDPADIAFFRAELLLAFFLDGREKYGSSVIEFGIFYEISDFIDMDLRNDDDERRLPRVIVSQRNKHSGVEKGIHFGLF